jgi:hypothetical protein
MMAAEIDGLFRESKVKWWLVAQIAAFVGWFSFAGVMAVLGVSALIQVVVMVLAALGFSFLIDPRRSWWGTGPTQVMTDPAARRRYRRSMIAALLIALVIGLVVVTALVATGIVEPSGA